ncbi:CamS family sex pheromone protein [Bacillus sp. FSL W7-1360]
MKRLSIMGLVSMLILSGCGWFESKDKQEKQKEVMPTEDLDVTSTVEAAEGYYRSIRKDGQYVHGDTRGVGASSVTTQTDLNWLEMGLQQIAQEHFDIEHYYFQEGAYIQREEVEAWLKRDGEGEEEAASLGLNPPLGEGDSRKKQEENSPLIVSRLLEHNYVTKDKDDVYEMGGIVIGIALNQVYQYRFRDDNNNVVTGKTEVEKAEREKKGMEAAEKIVQRMREKPLNPEASEGEEGPTLADVPIVIALFEESEGQSVTTGHFFKVAVDTPGKGLEWSDIKQRNLYFPSAAATEEKRDDAEHFDRFQEEIQAFSENQVGVVGRARYENNHLAKLVIDLNIQYHGKTEVVALTQYVAELVKKYYKNALVDVNVSAMTGELESVISHEPKKEPFMYIVN